MKIKEKRGITLIALVITVIILIILATVTLNVVLGEGGLIQRAQQGKDMTINATKDEEREINEINDKITNIIEEASKNIDSETGWDLNRVNKITSEDGIVLPVPIGYTASNATGEKSVDEGLVIYEGTEEVNDKNVEESRKTRNQFVWVPVENVNEMYGIDANGKKWGKLYEFDEEGITALNWTEQDGVMTILNMSSFREPDIIIGREGTEYDVVSKNLQEAGLASNATADTFKSKLEKEFNEMILSVEKYKGFYIGRYETGDLSKENAVILKNNLNINNQTWYTNYKLSKKIAANGNVASTIIWGSQWDATLRWMYNSGDEAKKKYTYNCIGKGNFYGTQGETNKLIPTGYNSDYAVNNIYDMAGNVWDATMEADSYYGRGSRGGDFNNIGSRFPPAHHNRDYPETIHKQHGLRTSLYIML